MSRGSLVPSSSPGRPPPPHPPPCSSKKEGVPPTPLEKLFTTIQILRFAVAIHRQGGKRKMAAAGGGAAEEPVLTDDQRKFLVELEKAIDADGGFAGITVIRRARTTTALAAYAKDHPTVGLEVSREQLRVDMLRLYPSLEGRIHCHWMTPQTSELTVILFDGDVPVPQNSPDTHCLTPRLVVFCPREVPGAARPPLPPPPHAVHFDHVITMCADEHEVGERVVRGWFGYKRERAVKGLAPQTTDQV